MSFSSRRRNYLLTPHRRDGLIEWMKSMLMHSFVLDALETTGADTSSPPQPDIPATTRSERATTEHPGDRGDVQFPAGDPVVAGPSRRVRAVAAPDPLPAPLHPICVKYIEMARM